MAEHNESCVVDTSMPAFAEMTVLARKQAQRMVTTAVKVFIYTLSCFTIYYTFWRGEQ